MYIKKKQIFSNNFLTFLGKCYENIVTNSDYFWKIFKTDYILQHNFKVFKKFLVDLKNMYKIPEINHLSHNCHPEIIQLRNSISLLAQQNFTSQCFKMKNL